ncbi:hypothetical protein [Streptomyces sp. Ag109_O5-10]|uniref:hypothetical protein n=1 Tax=Streptomyces sp. Ag109_O5-10 TaxID=1855349 RepID=UPI0008994F1C|nr:hypothetical protein [Streptomyces sp. Ag109_O5-10]SEE77137.1 hypothetical protein SAMN05216533_3624 [Streptomyces sp. Ag109_O5-10]
MPTIAATAALLLTACGASEGGDDGPGNDAKSTASGQAHSHTPSPSASSAHGNAPVFAFPSDVNTLVQRDPTGNPTKDTVLRDVAYSAQARLEAFANGDGRTANMNRYFAAQALTYWTQRVAKVRKDGLTVTGHYRFFNFAVTDVANARTAAARYCEDQTTAYSKQIKTGKILRTKPSANDFILITLQAAKDSRGDWQVTQQNWKKGDPTCVRG